jgi:hypothetical protein
MDPLKQGSGHVRTILPLDEPIALPPDVLVEQRGAELLEARGRVLERREDRLALVDLQAEDRVSLSSARRSRSPAGWSARGVGAAAARRRRGVLRTTVIVLPACSRPMVRVSDYRDLVASSTTGTIASAHESPAKGRRTRVRADQSGTRGRAGPRLCLARQKQGADATTLVAASLDALDGPLPAVASHRA